MKSKAEVGLDWTGVCTSTLWTMKEVEDGTRLAVGQTFPNRDLMFFGPLRRLIFAGYT